MAQSKASAETVSAQCIIKTFHCKTQKCGVPSESLHVIRCFHICQMKQVQTSAGVCNVV